MSKFAVIDCGFGDSGKGKTVSYLCSQLAKPLVIRFSGGQQAGHQVCLKSGEKHVFSNFGSGSLHGASTYWSKYCTVDPVGILNELDLLRGKDCNPTLYIDASSPVTTPYDKLFNVKLDIANQHGSCQVGVGQTYQREEDFFHLQFRDLFNETVLKIKLEMIRKYYYKNSKDISFSETYAVDFVEIIRELLSNTNIQMVEDYYSIPDRFSFSDIIFEGSQGLLLDQHYGFFPHVSRGNFGSTNILDMSFSDFSVTLVTRAYQTRHGNGPMTNQDLVCNVNKNPYEMNFSDGAQGKFRVSVLDLDLIRYSINRDPYIRQSPDKSLVITCLDLMEKPYQFTLNGILHSFDNEDSFVSAVSYELAVSTIHLSRTPFPEVD